MERKINLQHPEGLTDAQEILVLMLYHIKAIKFGDFKMKVHDEYPEAPLSPVYIDLRMLRRDVPTKQKAVVTYAELVRQLDFDLLADVPTAATPVVSSLSDKLEIGMITPRTDAKAHGTGTKIDGLTVEDKGKTALLVDDLITTAASKLEAVRILRSEGIVVRDVLVLIDREQGGKEALAKEGLTLHAAFTMKQMLDFYLRVGTITKEVYDDTLFRLAALNKFLKTS